MKVTIGDVLFRDIQPLEAGPFCGRQINVVGAERVALLRTFYQGHLLPGGIEAYALGRGTIDRTDVDWSSAGESVTGK